jgi:hypothetical protein
MFDTVQVGVLGFWGAGVVIDICAGLQVRRVEMGVLKLSVAGSKKTHDASRWRRQNARDEFRIVLKKVMIKFQRIDQEIIGPQNHIEDITVRFPCKSSDG